MPGGTPRHQAGWRFIYYFDDMDAALAYARGFGDENYLLEVRRPLDGDDGRWTLVADYVNPGPTWQAEPQLQPTRSPGVAVGSGLSSSTSRSAV